MSFQDRCPYKEGTGARDGEAVDGEAVKKIDSHHFPEPCIICRGCCCHNTVTAAVACGNVKANDVFYTANATNVSSLGTFRPLGSTLVLINPHIYIKVHVKSANYSQSRLQQTWSIIKT